MNIDDLTYGQTKPSLRDAINALPDIGAAKERKAIVAWLRSDGGESRIDPRYEIGAHLADAIERGEHFK
jgi:hypothetical protein